MKGLPRFFRVPRGSRPAERQDDVGFRGHVEELEPRILFSADAAGVLLGPDAMPAADLSGSIQQVLPPVTADATQASQTAPTAAADVAAAAARATEIVFIDARVPDAQQLMSQILAQQSGEHTLECHWLEADKDGVAQISDVLQGRHDIAALHLISHGYDGNVQLGDIWLNEDTLPAHLGQLSGWQSALTSDADILIYGCDVAATAHGQHFVDDLSLLTGADVAASQDRTGAASLGGNWQLEYQAGSVDRQLYASAATAPDWNHELATAPSLDLDGNNSSGATGSNFNATFTEQTPVNIADTDATVTAGTNAINTNVTSLTVTLTNRPDGTAESLSATTTGTNITSSYSTVTGILTLTGSDTAANYQQVLRTIQYNNTSDNPTTTTRTINFVVSDPYGGSSATATTSLAVSRVNDAPVITSNGGGATASVSVRENTTAVTTATATDVDSTTLTYSISGADAAKFSINATSGVLTFVSAPDFETPTDADANNVYEVTLQVSDGSATDTQAISVSVTDVSSALVVTTTADTNDSGLGTSFTAEQLNAANGGTDTKVSLREAIIAANSTAGTDTITFNISTGTVGIGADAGAYVITTASALPNLTQAVYIDASTQSGYVAGGLHTVVLDGNGGSGEGLYLSNTADGSTIRGLVIRDFSANGIYVQAASDNNTIVGNYIGSFYADGSNAGTGKRNASEGIETYGANLAIGGTTVADRNVISGNASAYNIYLGNGASGTVVTGNYLGTNAAGTSAFTSTNSTYGIMVENPVANVVIGGTASGAGNVVSGFTNAGIWLSSGGTSTVQGNYIGTDKTGTVALANGSRGIFVDEGSAIIGGTASGAGNVISGNTTNGIYANTGGSITVQGNIIGLNATGTAKLANGGAGIYLSTGTASVIGGNTASARNVISGNGGYGIDIESSPTGGHVVKGNYIGVAADGTTLLGNSLAGVYINATGVNIGGKSAGDGNIIAGNGGAGIAVAGGNGNLFYRNSIYSNTGLGIDLGNDGVTANDYNDGDGGANYSNNFPVITSVVTSGTTTTIQGSIEWAHGPDTVYIELFTSPTQDGTGYGEGKTYLGAAQVTINSSTGDATFSLTVSGVSVGDWITAVANIETTYIGASEFSKAVQAVAPTSAPRGRVIWNNNDRFFQYYADWSTTGFGGTGVDGLALGDDISMFGSAASPTRNEIIFVGSADVSGKVIAVVWNGDTNTWSTAISLPLSNPSATSSHYDAFAIAYDSISGDAMLLWNNGNTSTTGLSYATWNGTSWSSTGTITAPVSGEPLHMQIATKPASHEMTLVVQTSAASNNQYAIVWNGSSWGNTQTLGTNTNEQNFEINVAYEQLSGKAMVVYDNSSSNSPNVQYRTWNGTSWSSEGTITAPSGINAISDLYSTAIASDRTSNRIAIAAKDANNEIWMAVWNGSSWGSTQVATTSGRAVPEDHATMAVAFESQSGDLLVAYGKSAGPNVYYRTWTSSGGWSAELTGPSIGGTDIPYIIKLYADPYSNTIMMGVLDNGEDLSMVAWDGSAWGSVSEMDSATGFSYRENFTYVWYQTSVQIANIAGDTLAYNEDQSAQVIDQGTAATVTMGNESLYNGGNLTVSIVAGGTSSEDVLGIRNQGTGAGQIGVSGGNVTYAGTTIGTYTGGTGGSNLVITFNANATNAAVTALIKNITYLNSNTTTPSTTSRTVRFVATNSLGQDSGNHDATVTVAATNDAPTNTVPTGQTTNEDTSLVFSSGNGNLISIADVDAGSGSMQVTLAVTNGSLTLSGTSGLSFTAGDGTADTTMTFTGTVSAINTALAGMSYAPTANYNGSAQLTITTSDQGNTGTGGILSDVDNVAITVTAVNDAPVNTVPAAQTTNEDTSLVFSSGNGNLIGIADVDAGSGSMQVTLAVTNGSLTLSGTSGLSFTAGDGTADTTMTFTGTVSAINTALAGMSYAPTANYNGSAQLTITTSDQGNTGTGGTLSDVDNVAITVTAVNDAPVNTVPAAQTTNEDTSLVFSSGNGNLISIADVDAGSGSMQVTLAVTNGSLTLSGTSGLSFTAGDGTADTTMTFTGTVSAINTALAGMSYAPTANYNGSAQLTITTSDQGNTGTGGAKSDTDNVNITVTAVNDAPVNTVPAAQTTNEDTSLVFSSGNGNLISIADVDAGSGSMQVSLSVAHGTLTLSGTTGLSFTTGDGTADGTMVFTGTRSNINAALAGLSYTATANYNGSDSLNLLTSDLGNTGTGGTLTDSDSVAITVNAVNDAPVATITPVTYNATEQTPLNLHGTGLSIADVDAGNSTIQATLTVTSGTLTVSAGTTGVSVTGSASQAVTLSGTLSQINALLAGTNGATVSYLINSDAPPASDLLTLSVSDLGNTGAGGVLTGSDTAAIQIAAVNDAPTVSITEPGYTVVEAQTLALHNTGLSVNDPDGTSTSVQVTLSVDIGVLTITAGTTGAGIAGTGTASLTLTGTVTQINNLLAGNGGATIGFINNSGTPTASATLTLAIDDLGNTGGGNLSASANVAISVLPAASMGSIGIPGVQPTDVAAYYGFDSGSNLGRNDATGGVNMTLIGTPTQDTGIDGRQSAIALVNDTFNGGTQTGGTITGLATGGAMTLSTWVRFDSFNDGSGGWDRIVDFGQAGATGIGNIVMSLSATTHQVSFMLQHSGVSQDVVTTAIGDVVQAGQWTQIAATVDSGGAMRIYFNGALSGTFQGTALATGVRTNNFVGQSNDASAYGMNGAIDNLLVVNRAMSASEVAMLYNQASGFAVNEKSANGTVVGTVLDGPSVNGRTVTYSLVNSAGGRFAIDANTGLITVADASHLLYSDASSHSITVRATDNVGDSLDTTYTVNLLNVNDAPVGVSHTVTTLEDTAYTFGTADFGFSDPNDPSANALQAVKIVSLPTNGTLTLNGTAVSANDVIQASDIIAGKLQFTGATNGHGTGYTSFGFKVQDDGGTANGGVDTDVTTRTMTIDVTAVNDAPQGQNNTVTTLEDTPYVFNTADFGFNDVDGNSLLAVQITGLPTAGTLTLNGAAVLANDVITASDIASGLLVLTPAVDAHGASYAAFTFKVQDDGGTANGGVDLDSLGRTMTISVTSVNDAPAGSDGTITTNEDTAHVFTAGDFGFSDTHDSPANTLSAVKFSVLPNAGVLKLNGNALSVGDVVSIADINAGLLTFSPAANQNGAGYASIGFQVQDSGGTANGGIALDPTVRTLTIDVTAVNDAPTTSNTSGSGNEDNTITGSVTGNDVDGDTLTFSKATDPSHGAVSVASDGSFTYTPLANYNGSDSFTVSVSDGHGGTAISTVSITVNAVNDAPTANNPAISGNEDTVITGSVTGSDVDGDTLTYAKATNAAHGSVTVAADGSFSYTPTANYNGSDSFTVTVSDGQGGTTTSTVSITVNAVNDAPTASNIGVSGNEDNAVTGQVVGGDVDGDALTYAKASNPAHGAVNVAGDGSFTYTPTANYNGSDSFTVLVSDGHGGTVNTTVSVTVNPVNDAPQADNPSVQGNEDNAINGAIIATDVDGDTLSYTKSTDPAHGSVVIHSDGSFSYTPTANYNGNDAFTVTVSDGQGGSVLSTISVHVNAVNDVPAVNNPTVSGTEDQAIAGSVTASDADGDALSYQVATDPAHGSVSVATDGSFIYTPATNFHGADSFTVLVSDGQGGQATSTISISVSAVNDAPTANNPAVSGNEDTVITGSVTGSDVDGDTLTYAKATNAAHGSVTVAADGSFSYTPTANYNGSDSFTVTVSDGQGGTTTSTVSITVSAVNDAPVASVPNTPYAATEQLTLNLAGTGLGMLDVDAGATTVQATLAVTSGTLQTSAGSTGVTVTGSGSGTLTLTGTQDQINALLGGLQGATLTYTMAADAPPASDTLSLTIDDQGQAGAGGNLSASANVQIAITAVNDAPVMAPATLTANAAPSASWSTATLLAGAVDPDGTPLAVRIVQGPQHGSLSVSSNGQITYTTDSGYTGADGFSYEAYDGQTASAGTRVVTLQASSPTAVIVPVITPPSTDTGSGQGSTPSSTNTPATPTGSTSTSASATGPTSATPQSVPLKPAPVETGEVGTSDGAATLQQRIQVASWAANRAGGDTSNSTHNGLFTPVLTPYIGPTTADAANSSPVIQLLSLIQPTLDRLPDINLNITPLSGIPHVLPQRATSGTATAGEEAGGVPIRLAKVATYSTGLGLSIGTIWWTARISGLVTSALISTPAWRALDPLPVVTSPTDDEDDDEHDEHSHLGDREVEHLFDADRPIEQDLPVIQ